MRRLNDKFLRDLKEGVLAPLTDAVKSDTSLCLELRGDSINLYYRGGSLMRVDVKRPSGTYSAFFNPEYFKFGNQVDRPAPDIREKDDIAEWLDVSPKLKQAIDRYLAKIKKDERECQQRILHDNNFGSVASKTDYYICDIEYQSEHGHFDMIAVHWPSKRSVPSHSRRLVFVEVKHGDEALDGSSGLHAHIEDVNSYLSDPTRVRDLKKDMIDVFNQKRGLGLIDCDRDLASFSNERPLLLLALVNHNPESQRLRRLLDNLPKSPNAELRFATASFLGYGLYDQGIHPLDEWRRRFDDYIHKDLHSPG